MSKIELSSLTNEVYENLKAKIINEELEQGSRLIETQIAEELGVSRTPVKEAIAQLKEDGFVIDTINKGSCVETYYEEDVIDIFEIRLALEPLATTLVSTKASKEKIEEINDCLLRNKIAIDKEDYTDILKTNQDFHNAIFSATDNEWLQIAYNNISEHIQIILRAIFNENTNKHKLFQMYDEHKRIYEYIKSGNPKQASDLMFVHSGYYNYFEIQNIHFPKRDKLNTPKYLINKSKKDLRDVIHNELKHMIINGEFEQNQRLVESKIAEKLQVSRTPVRFAIKKLVKEKFAYEYPRKGVFVRDYQQEDIMKIFDVRLALEPIICESVVKNINSNDIEILESIIVNMQFAQENQNFNMFINLDDEFHSTLYRIAQNKWIEKTLHLISDHILKIKRDHLKEQLDNPQKENVNYYLIYKDHVTMLDIIKSRNAKALREFMRYHMTWS